MSSRDWKNSPPRTAAGAERRIVACGALATRSSGRWPKRLASASTTTAARRTSTARRAQRAIAMSLDSGSRSANVSLMARPHLFRGPPRIPARSSDPEHDLAHRVAPLELFVGSNRLVERDDVAEVHAQRAGVG